MSAARTARRRRKQMANNNNQWSGRGVPKFKMPPRATPIGKKK